MIEPWAVKGELILSCNCTVFCPCVVSLGKHPPTEGNCHGWAGIHIEEGHYGSTPLEGLNVGMLLDIPGNMGRGNWTAAAYIDERAGEDASAALEKIFSGQARGTTGLFNVLVSNFLGVKQVPIKFEKEGRTRHFSIPKKIEGIIEPIAGADADKDVVIQNTQYWMGSEVVVSRAVKSRVRDWGRVWDFNDRSAEFCRIDWSGP